MNTTFTDFNLNLIYSMYEVCHVFKRCFKYIRCSYYFIGITEVLSMFHICGVTRPSRQIAIPFRPYFFAIPTLSGRLSDVSVGTDMLNTSLDACTLDTAFLMAWLTEFTGSGVLP